MARSQGQPDRAARLLGAAKALSDTSGSYRGLAGSLIMERTTAAVLAQLDDETFAVMWAEGQNMTLVQASEEALNVAA